MTDQPVDLRALGLDHDEHESLVIRILAAAAPELARRAGGLPPVAVLQAWSRPILAFAASIVVIAGATFVWSSRTASPEVPVGGVTLAEELRVPTPVASWVTERREPTTDDLLVWIADVAR